MIRELIAPTDAAVTDPVAVPRNFHPAAIVSIGASGLSGAEAITVWERFTADGEWQAAKQWGAATETAITVTAASGRVDIGNAAARLGVTKPLTMYPVGVYAITQDLIGT